MWVLIFSKKKKQPHSRMVVKALGRFIGSGHFINEPSSVMSATYGVSTFKSRYVFWPVLLVGLSQRVTYIDAVGVFYLCIPTMGFWRKHQWMYAKGTCTRGGEYHKIVQFSTTVGAHIARHYDLQQYHSWNRWEGSSATRIARMYYGCSKTINVKKAYTLNTRFSWLGEGVLKRFLNTRMIGQKKASWSRNGWLLLLVWRSWRRQHHR